MNVKKDKTNFIFMARLRFLKPLYLNDVSEPHENFLKKKKMSSVGYCVFL